MCKKLDNTIYIIHVLTGYDFYFWWNDSEKQQFFYSSSVISSLSEVVIQSKQYITISIKKLQNWSEWK